MIELRWLLLQSGNKVLQYRSLRNVDIPNESGSKVGFKQVMTKWKDVPTVKVRVNE